MSRYNAIVIGASAYENLLMRIWMIIYQIGSAIWTMGFTAAAGGMSSASVTPLR